MTLTIGSSAVSMPIVARHVAGVRFAAQVRSHVVYTDQRQSAGGGDSSPNPVELLGAALGSCIAFYVHQFLFARELPTEGMRVEIQQRNAASPARVGEFRVRVVLGFELPARDLPVLRRVISSCPVHNTLAPGASIDVEVVAVSEPLTLFPALAD